MMEMVVVDTETVVVAVMTWVANVVMEWFWL